MQSLASPLVATEQFTSPAKTTHHKKESAEDHKVWKATEAPRKTTAKPRAVKPLPEAVSRLARSQVTVSMGSMVTHCINGIVCLGSLVLMPVYDTIGNKVSMSDVLENLPPPPVSVDILRGKSRRCSVGWKNLQAVLEDTKSENYLEAVRKQGSNEEGSHPAE